MSIIIHKIIAHLRANDMFDLDWVDVQERPVMDVLEGLGIHSLLTELDTGKPSEMELMLLRTEIERMANANQTRAVMGAMGMNMWRPS